MRSSKGEAKQEQRRGCKVGKAVAEKQKRCKREAKEEK